MPSLLPEARTLRSSENASAPTGSLCLSNARSSFPVRVSQRRRSVSDSTFGLYHLPVARMLPSEERPVAVHIFPFVPVGTAGRGLSSVPWARFQVMGLWSRPNEVSFFPSAENLRE